MGARTKLNAAAVNGAVIFSVVIGLWLQSWSAFFAVLAVCLIGAVHGGSIRFTPRR